MTLTRVVRSLTAVLFPLVVGCQTAGSGEAKPTLMIVDADSLALRIDCQPEEAEVRVDGVLQGSCRLFNRPESVLKLPAGAHELEVAADGFRIFRSMVSGSCIQESLTVRLVQHTPRTPRTAE